MLEVVDDEDGDTFRAVYTVRFAGVIYVLHSFQKKSKKGIETPKHDIEVRPITRRTTEKEAKNEQGYQSNRGQR